MDTVKLQKEIFREIFDTLPEPISIKEAGSCKFVYVNEAFEEFVGKPKDSIIGKSCDELFEGSLAKSLIELDEKLLASGKSIRTTLSMKVGEQNEIFEIKKLPHFPPSGDEIDYIIDIYNKTTNEHRADEILRDTEVFFQNVFEHLPLGVLVVRENDFAIINVNPFFLNLFNLELDQILYKPIFELELCKDKEKIKSYFAIAKEYGIVHQVEEKCNLKSGKSIDVVLHIVYVKYLDQEPWFLLIVGDVSLINQANREIISLIQKEQELQVLKNRFISLISHELRTPLSGIMLSVDLLQRFGDKLSRDEKEKHFERIRESIQIMTKMIENSMHLEKLASEDFVIQPTKICLQSYLKDIVKRNETFYNSKNPIILQVLDEVEIETDEVLFGLILNNLIGNAFKYSQFDTPIYIKSKLVDGYLKIQIQNFGEPIPLDEIPKLFNLFYRGRNASSTKGYGIGLAIVKKAVDALKGIIEVESSLENGTIFTILLPTRVQV